MATFGSCDCELETIIHLMSVKILVLCLIWVFICLYSAVLSVHFLTNMEIDSIRELHFVPAIKNSVKRKPKWNLEKIKSKKMM
jgi:hypothetical protein